MSERLIADLAEINPTLRRVPRDQEIVGFIPMSAVSESGRLNEVEVVSFGDVKAGFTRFQDNDVLFAKITPCMENGKGALVRYLPAGVGCGSTEFHVLRVKPGSDAGYIFQLMQWARVRQSAERFMSGSAGQQRVLSDFFFRCKVYAPSLGLQQKIAAILDVIDQTIEKTEALIEKYQQIKAGLMHDLFTRGIGADGKLRPPREQAPELYQQTPIEWIPKEWELKQIGQVFSIQLGKMLSRAAKTGKSEFNYLGNKNVQWDTVDLEGLEAMDFHPDEREKFRLSFGDLLVCEGGDVGRTAMWRDELEDCYYQKAIHRLRPIDGKVMPEFMLRFMFYAKNTGMLTNFTSQTSIAHLTRENLSIVKVFVPGIDEQKELVRKFDSVDQKIAREKALLEKLQKQKSGLMHDLLTGKVQVKVNEFNAEARA